MNYGISGSYIQFPYLNMDYDWKMYVQASSMLSKTKQDCSIMTAGTYSSIDTPLMQLVDLQTHLFTRGKVVKAVDHVNLTIHKGILYPKKRE